MDRKVRERHQIEMDLRVAMDSGCIQTVYQPSFNLKSGEVVGFEAAPVWIHPNHGVIPAERFIPIAEETGLIHQLAAQLLREACAAAALWPPPVILAGGLFPRPHKDRVLKGPVRTVLDEVGLPGRALVTLITGRASV